MPKKRKKGLSEIDILNMLPRDVGERFSALGFEFLKAQGYDTTDAETSSAVQRRIAAELEKNRSTLIHRVVLCSEDKSVVLWFDMLINGRVKASSEKMKVYLIPSEDANNETEDREDTQ